MRDRRRETKIETEKEREVYRQRETDREIQRDRKTERQTERQSVRSRDREGERVRIEGENGEGEKDRDHRQRIYFGWIYVLQASLPIIFHIPSLWALWKIESCQMSSLCKVSSKQHKTNKHSFAVLLNILNRQLKLKI